MEEVDWWRSGRFDDTDVTSAPRNVELDVPTSNAFAALYTDHYREMVALARVTTGSKAHAEEIVQDVFARMYPIFDTIAIPVAYLRRSVVNGCRSWIRRQVTARHYADRTPANPPPWNDPDTSVVMDAIGRLPQKQRAAIFMRYISDLPERDIAAALGCPPGTVKSLLARARSSLAKELGHD